MMRLKEQSDPTADNGKKPGEIRSRQTDYEAISGADILIFFLVFMGTA